MFNGLKWSILRLKYQHMSESKERVTLVSLKKKGLMDST